MHLGSFLTVSLLFEDRNHPHDNGCVSQALLVWLSHLIPCEEFRVASFLLLNGGWKRWTCQGPLSDECWDSALPRLCLAPGVSLSREGAVPLHVLLFLPEFRCSSAFFGPWLPCNSVSVPQQAFVVPQWAVARVPCLHLCVFWCSL